MPVFQNKVISLYDKKTSLRLADIEWKILDEICRTEKIKRKHLLEQIHEHHCSKMSFSYTIRVFALLYYYGKSSDLYYNNYLIKILHML